MAHTAAAMGYCRYCREKIQWAKTEKLKRIPLDWYWTSREEAKDGQVLFRFWRWDTDDVIGSVGFGGYACHLETCTVLNAWVPT